MIDQRDKVEIETNPSQEKLNRTMAWMQDAYSPKQVKIDSDTKTMTCSAKLEYGQRLSTSTSFKHIIAADDDYEIFILRQALNLSDEEIARRISNLQTINFLIPVGRIQISQVTIDDQDFTPRLFSGKAKRLVLALPNLKCKEEIITDGYPVTDRMMMDWVPDKYYDFDRGTHKSGDIYFRPILTERDLLGFLHEFGHSLSPKVFRGYEDVSRMSRREISSLINSSKKKEPRDWSEKERHILYYRLKEEEDANERLLAFLEQNPNLRKKLLPGEGMDRTKKYIAKQIQDSKTAMQLT